MNNKLYYYVISLVGFETYKPVTVIHTKKMSKKSFYKLVRDVLTQLLVDNWEPYDFEVPERVAEILVTNYGFKLLQPVCEYQHKEDTFFRWVINFNDNLKYPERATWKSYIVKRPKWLPKDIIDLVEAKIVAQVKIEKSKGEENR